jgi:hypothetical protein
MQTGSQECGPRPQENIFQKLGTTLTKAGTQPSGSMSTRFGTRKGQGQHTRDENVILSLLVAWEHARRKVLVQGFKVRAGVRSLAIREKLIATAQSALGQADRTSSW